MKNNLFEAVPPPTPTPAEAAAEAKRKAAEKAALEAEKAADEAEKKRLESMRDALEKKRLQTAAQQAGITPATPTSAMKSAANFGVAAAGGQSITNKLMFGAAGLGYGLARAGLGRAAGLGVAATKAAGRGIGKIAGAAPSIAKKAYQGAVSGAGKTAAAGIAATKAAGRALGLTSSYDYSELVRSLSRLDEQQYQQLLQQIDDDQIELVESAMQVVNMGPGYNRLRTRLVYKFDESAPVNAVGAGENIAGINPPAGPALLGSSKLKGVAAGATAKQIAKRHGVPLASIIKQLEMGAEVEREHTQDAATAQKIAMDHVFEDPKYYSKLARMEGGKTTKQENYDIGNNTRFTMGDRLKDYRITMMQTRRQTNAHPGNPGIEHA